MMQSSTHRGLIAFLPLVLTLNGFVKDRRGRASARIVDRSMTIALVLAVKPKETDDAITYARGGGREPRWRKALGIGV